MNQYSSLSPNNNPSGGTKRKDPPPSASSSGNEAATATAGTTMKVTPPTNAADDDGSNIQSSPYETRKALLKEYDESAGENYIQFEFMGDVLDVIPNKLEDLDVDDVDELSEEELKVEYSKLTMEEVDKYYHVVIVRKSLIDQVNTFAKQIYNADPRNGKEGCFIMLDTHSSWCMYPIINKQLSKAQRLLTQAMKGVITTPNVIVANVAQEAFETTLAAILACDEVDHWRLDTESPEDCDKIAKKVSKLLKELLWFHDEELGLIDPFSRKSLLQRFNKLSDDWKDIEWMKSNVSFASSKNGNGMGRPLLSSSAASADAAAPPAKKQKMTTVTNSGGGSADSTALDYLNALGDKLRLRVKTQIQLEICDGGTNQTCRVVCSGATCMKKLGQLAAFLTGHTDDYHYHSQRGKSLKGSYFELSVGDGPNKSKLWIGESQLEKTAKKIGIGHVIDKTIKVVQVFQGLIIAADSGLVYDSQLSKTASLKWVVGNTKRYSVKVQGIMPTKSCEKPMPLPRVVDDDNCNPRKKMGFAKFIHHTNTKMRGDRAGVKPNSFFCPSKSELNRITCNASARPICNANGSFGDLLDDFEKNYYFRKGNIQSAGPPAAS